MKLINRTSFKMILVIAVLCLSFFLYEMTVNYNWLTFNPHIQNASSEEYWEWLCDAAAEEGFEAYGSSFKYHQGAEKLLRLAAALSFFAFLADGRARKALGAKGIFLPVVAGLALNAGLAAAFARFAAHSRYFMDLIPLMTSALVLFSYLALFRKKASETGRKGSEEPWAED